MNILVNGNLILLRFPVGRCPADSQIHMFVCLKNVASAFVYGGFEGFLFHLLQSPSLVDGLNDIHQESLQGHSPCQPGMTLQVSDEK